MLIQSLVNNPILVTEDQVNWTATPFRLLMNSNMFVINQLISDTENFRLAHKPYTSIDPIPYNRRDEIKINQFFTVSEGVLQDWATALAPMMDAGLRVGDQILRYRVTAITDSPNSDFFARSPALPKWTFYPPQTSTLPSSTVVECYLTNPPSYLRRGLCNPTGSMPLTNYTTSSVAGFSHEIPNINPNFLVYKYKIDGRTISNPLATDLDSCRGRIMLNNDVLAHVECSISVSGNGSYQQFLYKLLIAGGPEQLPYGCVLEFY